MTGSKAVRAATEASAEVDISSDYKAGFSDQSPVLRLEGSSTAHPLLPHRNLEIHQLIPFGIINPAHIDARAGQGCVDVFHIEEEESGLRGVRLDRSGGESRGFDLVSLLLTDGAFHVLVRDGKWQRRRGVGARIGEASVDIVGRFRGQLVAVRRGQCYLYLGDRDGLVAVVGYDEEDGQ